MAGSDGAARVVPSQAINFNGGGPFYSELKARVNEFLDVPGRAARAQRAMYVKTAVIVGWAAASWALLLFWADTWWQGGLLAVSLGFALAGIGFNVSHDANHGSYSPHRWLNRSMRWILDLIGASSYIWRVKHNVIHHTFTNISGADADIEQLPFLRMAPDQPQRWFHRYQHLYAWPLYGLMSITWQLGGDFKELKVGHIEGTPIKWPRGGEMVGFWAGKAAFVSWAILIPLIFHPWWQVAIGFLLVSFVLAATLAVVFQLAHNIEEAEVMSLESLTDERVEWARHQVETTVDFAPRSRFLTWYLGGLNFQIEHHLFTRVCHTHYPSLAPVVQEVCASHGIQYRSHDGLWSALRSHTRWLRRMGQQPVVAAAV